MAGGLARFGEHRDRSPVCWPSSLHMASAGGGSICMITSLTELPGCESNRLSRRSLHSWYHMLVGSRVTPLWYSWGFPAQSPRPCQTVMQKGEGNGKVS